MRLVTYPDPILLRPADPVRVITDEVREKAKAMIPYMVLEKGVGLAAPQVGWGVRVLVASEDGQASNAQVLVNPVMTRKGGAQEWGEEGCLSFPEIYGDVARFTEITVVATDLDGNPVTLEARDFFARVLQHEIDHLDGILFVTKMRPADKAKNRARLQELVRSYETARVPADPRR